MILFDKLITEKQSILDKIFNAVNNSTVLLTYFNQHCFNTYFINRDYREFIDRDFIVYSEGVGMKFFFWFVLKKRIKRIDATFLYDIMGEISNHSEEVFFVGGNFNEDHLRKVLKEKGLNLTCYQGGYFNEVEKNIILQKISSDRARFIIIGMGVPKQEIFAGELKNFVRGKIIICVGNFFEFYFGTVKRAPLTFQKLGLEWFFRILTEPKRLWRRYIFGIPEFIYRVIKLKFERK